MALNRDAVRFRWGRRWSKLPKSWIYAPNCVLTVVFFCSIATYTRVSLEESFYGYKQNGMVDPDVVKTISAKNSTTWFQLWHFFKLRDRSVKLTLVSQTLISQCSLVLHHRGHIQMTFTNCYCLYVWRINIVQWTHRKCYMDVSRLIQSNSINEFVRYLLTV